MGYGQNPLDYPFSWVPFSFSSVDLIFSNRQNNPCQISYFSYFYACGNSTFKTSTKTKRNIILKNLQTFSHSPIGTFFLSYIFKIDPISDNKLFKDDMKIIQLLRRLLLKSQNIKVQTLYKMNVLYLSFCSV